MQRRRSIMEAQSISLAHTGMTDRSWADAMAVDETEAAEIWFKAIKQREISKAKTKLGFR
jgi:hypothetical protein